MSASRSSRARRAASGKLACIKATREASHVGVWSRGTPASYFSCPSGHWTQHQKARRDFLSEKKRPDSSWTLAWRPHPPAHHVPSGTSWSASALRRLASLTSESQSATSSWAGVGSGEKRLEAADRLRGGVGVHSTNGAGVKGAVSAEEAAGKPSFPSGCGAGSATSEKRASTRKGSHSVPGANSGRTSKSRKSGGQSAESVPAAGPSVQGQLAGEQGHLNDQPVGVVRCFHYERRRAAHNRNHLDILSV